MASASNGVACHHPLPAWRGIKDGRIHLTQPTPKSVPQDRRLALPCMQCLGCRKTIAQGWTLRCKLELQQHDYATFATLTYRPEDLPPTLSKLHLQLFLKRLRINAERQQTANAIRFFACGEYGTQRGRPHYHAILYGLHHEKHRELIENSWGLGSTQTREANNRRIAYTAGYVAKKYNDPADDSRERIDYQTGEVYEWQPPFIQMSRRPGIGGHARQWPASWRKYAIYDGRKIAVPRFYHEAWKKQATDQEKEELLKKKAELALRRDTSEARLKAAEKIQKRKNEIREQSRKLA